MTGLEPSGTDIFPDNNNDIRITKKIGYFFFAWYFSVFVLPNPIYGFINILNKDGILNFGEKFDASQIFWGDRLWPNLIKIILLIIFSGIFGFVMSYRINKITISEKILFCVLYSFLSIFFSFILFIIFMFVFYPPFRQQMPSVINNLLTLIKDSPFALSILLFQYICSFLTSLFFINKPNMFSASSKTDSFYGVKGYHFLWLWIPIHVYGLVILNLIYFAILTIIKYLRNFRILDFLGFKSSGEYSREITSGKLFFYGIIAFVSIAAFAYIWNLLSHKKEVRTGKMVVLCFLLGIILPVIIGFYVLGIAKL